MIKVLRYTAYLYLGVAAVSLYKVITLWHSHPEEAYMFIFFALASIAMFAFRRRYHKRFEQQKNKPS